MRYQMAVLDEEIVIDINLDELSWQVHPAADPSAEFADVMVYQGYCASDQLQAVFDDNYIPGTRILVYDSTTQVCSGSADEWFTIVLETPFTYLQADGNLIVEVQWSVPIDGQSFYTWGWDTGTIRSISGDYGSSTGTMSSMMVMLRFEGDLSLTQMTHSAIKALFGAGVR